MNREEHLELIRKLQFYAVDLNLYLDNYPNNAKATEDYRFVSEKLTQIICDYEQKYGPLTNFASAHMEDPEAWVNSPWPWEQVKGGK